MSFLNGGQVCIYWLQDRKQGANKAINEQISVIRFLWVLFDERLTWRQRVDKWKCEKVNNLLRCLAVWDQGATIATLLNVQQTVMGV